MLIALLAQIVRLPGTPTWKKPKLILEDSNFVPGQHSKLIFLVYLTCTHRHTAVGCAGVCIGFVPSLTKLALVTQIQFRLEHEILHTLARTSFYHNLRRFSPNRLLDLCITAMFIAITPIIN